MFSHKEGVVYKTIVSRSLGDLINTIKALTELRREWICSTIDAGWNIEYESYDGDKDFIV